MNFDEIHNYYEQLVINHIVERARTLHQLTDEDLIVDAACIALNRLPGRYIRHDVDMAFFLTSGERERMQQRVTHEIDAALRLVIEREKRMNDDA